MYEARVCRVMIASPGDVKEERGLIREVIYEWNSVNSERNEFVLLPVGWETHASPDMGQRAQAIINKEVLRDCDLLVAAFWTRIGSPTGTFPSGSVEEIEEHINAGKPAMIYFSSAPVRPDSVNQKQYQALTEFKAWCTERGLVEHYDNTQDFRQKFTRQLALKVISRFLDATDSADKKQIESFIESLSGDAIELLVEASKDKYGRILRLGTMNGMSIRTNGRDFVEYGNVRSEARWKEALRELEAAGLIETENRQVYSVTQAGYKYAEGLGL